MIKKLHILIYSHSFPNPAEPICGNFIYKNLELYPLEIDFKVIAPIPYFLSVRRTGTRIKIAHHEKIQIGRRIVDVFRPRFFLLPRRLFRCFIGWGEYKSTYKTIENLNQIWKIDLIHVHFGYPDGIAVRHIAKKLNIRYVITEHQGAIDSFLSNRYIGKQILDVYRQSQQVITVSNFTKKAIHTYDSSLPDSKIKVIPNGVQNHRFIQCPKKSNPQKLIYIGNLIETKGIHLLIEALSELINENYNLQLSLIGGGNYRKQLEKQVRHLNLTDSVFFYGVLSAENVARILPEHDILVLPSFIESFSIVLVEAMACGMPVIATKCGGPEEIVNPETGILVEPKSAEALSDGIKHTIRQWHSFSPQKIQKHYINNYNLQDIVDSICNLYYQL